LPYGGGIGINRLRDVAPHRTTVQPPLKKRAPAAITRAEEDGPDEPAATMILVADPRAASAALISRHLEGAGYRCITAANGNEALAMIDEQRPTACVLEVMLGAGPTGYEIVRQMRALPDTELTPVVLMSARAGKLDRDFAFTVGANDYFKKPFRCGELITRLEALAPLGAAPRRLAVRRRRGCRPQTRIALAAR
jgi:CheY-like chemotaxis protein